MNLNVLEKLTRQALSQGDITEKSNEMLSKGFISPVEHRSLSSLSWQIAANMKATGEGTVAWAKPLAIWW
jgi:ribulose bisphosphate carboxylase small subunit